MSRAWWGFFLWAVAAVFGVLIWQNNYALRRDITDPQHVASLAGDKEDMIRYLEKTIDGLESHNMTEGNSSLIAPTDRTDMATVYRLLHNYLEEAEKLDPDDPLYHSELDDLRDTIGELVIPAQGYWFTHGGFFLYLIALGLAVWGYLVIVRN